MPNTFDLGLVAALAIWQVWDHFHDWPKFCRRVAEGRAGARLRYYRGILLGEWLFSALVMAAWLRDSRPWGPLGLASPNPIATLLSLVLCGALAMLLARQVRGVAASAAAQGHVRKLADEAYGAILPRTPAEIRLFMALSITAGICEEFLFRGFLMWVIGRYAGVFGAVLISSALFGLAHSYQGFKGIVRSGVLGAVMAGVYLATRSLYPGMALHALIDIGSGLTIYAALREDRVTTPAPTA